MKNTIYCLCLGVWLLLGINPGVSIASESELRILTTIRPLHSLAAAVTQGIATPELLIENNSSPHLFQLKPSHIGAISEADVILWAGPGVEAFMQPLIEKFALDSKLIELASLPGIARHGVRSEYRALSQSDESDSDNNQFDVAGHPDAAESVVEQSELDYHLWLDPHNAKLLVHELAVQLGKLDPSNSERYRLNGERFKYQLFRTAIDIDTQLLEYRRRPYLVFHDSFQYFEKAFGLGEPTVVALQPQVVPGAKRLKALREEIAGRQLNCLFAEPQFRSPMVVAISKDLNLPILSLDPLGSGLAGGSTHYTRLLRNTAAVLAECFRLPAHSQSE